MDGASMNQYEKQLYSVFKTFDVDNDEALDRSAVLELCDTLQLENRGTALVDSLFERRTDRVTFTQFRNGLLSVLGGESPPKPDQHEPEAIYTSPQSDRASPPQSDDESSGREIAPKFVFGSKKYGRRSRPPRASSEESPRHRVSSESRLDCERTKQRMKCKRSASAMENRSSFLADRDSPDLDHDRRIDRERALALCHSLHMNGVERHLIDRIFESTASDQITVGEFFEKLNTSLTTSIVSLNESDNVDSNLISSDCIVEMWERCGVEKPRRLLLELGFTSAAVRPAELERALDEELRALNVSADTTLTAHSILLLAAHALACLRLDTVRRQFDIVQAERDKLRLDLGEANRRARMLAQDVDDNHARIEDELKTNLRLMEAKQTEAAKALAAEVAAEKEKALAARVALEEELVRRTEVEARLRAELEALRDRSEEYQEQARGAEARAAQAERERTRLQSEIREAEERSVIALEQQRSAIEDSNMHMQELRLENQKLRDRNDELLAELEAGGRRKSGGFGAPATSWLDESGLHDSSDSAKNSIDTEDYNSLQFDLDHKTDVKTFLARLCESIESIRRIPVPRDTETCHVCVVRSQSVTALLRTVQELCQNPPPHWLADSGGCAEAAQQTETAAEQNTDTLKRTLSEVSQQYETDKDNLTSVIRDLESSLELMKVEYEKCEEYWSNKVECERQEHLAEMRAGDERLAALAAHVTDYERQFARLPPISERYDLEQELASLQREMDDQLAVKEEEIKKLKEKIEELERRQSSTSARPVMLRCAELEGQLRRQAQDAQRSSESCCASGGGGGRGACGACAGAWGWALRTRAVRAERAAQRLHARLAAADLLVKDLYLENCRLAHRP